MSSFISNYYRVSKVENKLQDTENTIMLLYFIFLNFQTHRQLTTNSEKAIIYYYYYYFFND